MSRAQLLEAGWSTSTVSRAIAGARLHPVARGVYRVSGAPWSRRSARWAALLIAGPHAVLARWSAAEVHAIAEPRPGPVDVLVPPPRRGPAHPPSFAHVQRSRTLRPDERCEVDGIAATTGARTLLDLAGRVPSGPRLAELVAAAVRVGACDAAGVGDVLARHPNAPGRAHLRAALVLLGEDGVEARSAVEVAALGAIVDAGLPRPHVAYRILTEDGRAVAEVDLAYPERRIAIEIDGYRWHSTPAQKRRDEDRQNQLILAGWRVLRFSASEVRHRPELLVATIRRALADAA